MRAADLGYAPRFLSFFVALSVSRFGGESTLPPQAANANRWAVPCKKGILALLYYVFNVETSER